MVTPAMSAASKNRLILLNLFHQTLLVCTICTAMFGSGLRTVGTAAIAVRQVMAVLGRAVIVANECCAAALGAIIRMAFAPLTATLVRLWFEIALTVFVLFRLYSVAKVALWV